MPCIVEPTYSEYEQKAEELNRQKGINGELEAQLCKTNTLLIKILLQNPGIITSPEDTQLISEIKKSHLEHRVEELELLKESLIQKLKQLSRKQRKLLEQKQKNEQQGFIAGESFYKNVERIDEETGTIKEKIKHIDIALNGNKNNEQDLINHILTNRNIGY